MVYFNMKGDATQPYGRLLCHVNYLEKIIRRLGRSQWPRGLRRGSAAVRPQGLWVRIPPGHGCLSVVSVVCCQIEVSATD